MHSKSLSFINVTPHTPSLIASLFLLFISFHSSSVISKKSRTSLNLYLVSIIASTLFVNLNSSPFIDVTPLLTFTDIRGGSSFIFCTDIV